MAQAIQQQWKKAGIDTTLDTMEWAAYLAATRKPVDQADVELFILGWAPSSAEARYTLVSLLTTGMFVPTGATGSSTPTRSSTTRWRRWEGPPPRPSSTSTSS